MSTPAHSNNMGNITNGKTIKLSREYPKTAENAKLLKQYLDQNGREKKAR